MPRLHALSVLVTANMLVEVVKLDLTDIAVVVFGRRFSYALRYFRTSSQIVNMLLELLPDVVSPLLTGHLLLLGLQH